MQVIQTDDLTACIDIRHRVFVLEQNVAQAEEVDGKDPDCMHYLLLDNDTAIGTLRVMALSPNVAKIQRVAVLPDARGKGAGSFLMRQVLGLLKEQDFRQAILGSQVHALGFYQALGFVADGPIYDDAGIAHRDMSINL